MEILVWVTFFVVVFAFFYGVIKCFQRNAIVAILLFLFFFPGLALWAFWECFTPPVNAAN